MTELIFKGKEFVYNHHLSVPFRPLEVHSDKGIGKPTLDGNLIIHGDNLHALKALMPRYAARIDCIFIDPLYNTGNESWCYNDNVNAPMIREWLDSNPIGIEDGLRHDKWCAMMWPRLRLLHELLSESGTIFITIDDNEVHHLRMIMDAIFDSDNFITSFVWHHRKSSQNDIDISLSHNYVLCYAKNKPECVISREAKDTKDFTNPDNDPRGPWTLDPMDAPNFRANLTYPITNPNTGKVHYPPEGRHWRFSQDEFRKAVEDKRIVFGYSGTAKPYYKRYLDEAQEKGDSVSTMWTTIDTATNAKKHINQIFNEKNRFDTPKPVSLIKKIISLAMEPNGIILDSFAGSGTTAQAVLQANKNDGGNRSFILVEMEEYADHITAERVRRVINGYSFKGKQKSELLREKITWRKLQNVEKLTQEISRIENLHGHEYNSIKKTIKEGELVVTGEKVIKDQTEGLGGNFTYCTLGEPVELNKLLNGESLPHFEEIGSLLFHMATNQTIDPGKIVESEGYLGEVNDQHIWLIYKPDLEWLKSPDAALTLSRAKGLVEDYPDQRHLVFAPARYVSQKLLDEQKLAVEFAPLPFALYRIDRS